MSIFNETAEQKRKRLIREEEDRKRCNSDDNSSFTGSPIVDGILGIPSSPLAIAIDMVTPGGLFDSNSNNSHDSGSNDSSSSYDSGSSDSSSSYDSSSSDSSSSSSFD